MAIAREFHFQDGSSNKFWRISLEGESFTVTFGRLGTTGQTQTKSFADAAAAKKEHDKLVAEKVKKGYVEIGGGAASTPAPASPTQPSAAKKKAPSKAVDKVEPAKPPKSDPPGAEAKPQVLAAGPVERKLHLSDLDWRQATWRNLPPLPKATPRPADLEACAAILSKLPKEQYGWSIAWWKADLQVGMPPEEAHFWLEAMTTERDRELTTKKLAEKTLAKKFTGKLSFDATVKLLNRPSYMGSHEIAIPLASLHPLSELVELVLSPDSTAGRKKSEMDKAEIARGLARYAFPYSSEAEKAAIVEILRGRWQSVQILDDHYGRMPIEVILAANLGLHSELHAIVAAWADKRYSGDDWHDHYQRPQDVVLGLGSADAIAHHWRRLNLRFREPEQLRAFLASTEYSALDCVERSLVAETNKENCEKIAKAFAALVEAPEAAGPMLASKLGSKAPAVARQWLEDHPAHTLLGLTPIAAGAGKLAAAAMDHLKEAKRKGMAPLLASLLPFADADAAATVKAEVLDKEEKVFAPLAADAMPPALRDALAASSAGKKALPGFVSVELLPPLVVGDGCLGSEDVKKLLQEMSATPVGQRTPLISAVRELASPRSRDALAWKLFEDWLADGAPSKDKWAMGAIGHIGADESAIKLTPLVRNWPGESQHQRAVFGLECLRGIGSDVALMQLSGIAQKLKFKGLKAKAEQFVEEIAAERGMSRAELEDRVVPDCGLDEHGRREFSFGPRSFSFLLGPELKPLLRDADGKLKPDLPKANAKDDAALAEQSTAEWKLLKKQIREVATIQAGRLEQAMVTGRRWKPADFETLLVRHPLMTHLARKLVWAGYDAKGQRISTFRVTDERDLADVEDQPATLDGFASVGVLHALEMTPAETAQWGQSLGDYEIVPPFPQLGRAVNQPSDKELKGDDLSSFAGLKLPAPTLVFGLEKLGWIRGTGMDGGGFDEHSKQFPAANITAVVFYDGCVSMGYITPDEELTMAKCQFVRGLRKPSGYGFEKEEKILKIAEVDRIVLSEVMADLHVLKAKAK